MILRTSSHTIKFANTGKKVLYKKIVSDYQWLLQKYIDLIYEKKLPLKTNLSSKDKSFSYKEVLKIEAYLEKVKNTSKN